MTYQVFQEDKRSDFSVDLQEITGDDVHLKMSES